MRATLAHVTNFASAVVLGVLIWVMLPLGERVVVPAEKHNPTTVAVFSKSRGHAASFEETARQKSKRPIDHVNPFLIRLLRR